MYRVLSTWLCLILLSCGAANAYDYPFTDPYVATVLGTPAEFAAVLPEDVPIKNDSIVMFPERKVPGVLWNFADLNYSYIKVDGPAPLIFLIAGTGASFESEKMISMQRAFYGAGFNVISLSSPTFTDFVVSASSSQVPGNLEEDSADLYRVMQAVWAIHQDEMDVTEFYLTGYSLGAAQSVFLSQIDDTEKAFNFSKVLLINPPLSLYNSVVKLDKMLEDNIPGGMDHFAEFYQKVIHRFGKVYKNGDAVQLNDQFLYKAYLYDKPKTDEPTAAMVGLSFRLSSVNMVFVSDVMTQAGYVVPKGLVLERNEIIIDYGKVLSQLTFIDYFNGIFMPHFKAQDPTITETEVISRMSLRNKEKYLRNTTKIGLIHNQDDIIMLPGEVDYLKGVFGDRATIYPHGGHCGNMSYPDNVTAMVGFFKGITQK
ncbi:alpha/beta hydrolase [Desulforhopalus vacuolatus]|nr:alpha/beta hydrolase [Desulforhopalus vacuolatus]